MVFGATGLVGNELVKLLSSYNEYQTIITVTRNKINTELPKVQQCIVKDFSQIEERSSQLNASVYFCCIGTTIKNAGSQEAFRKVDLDIPVQIAHLAERLSVPALVIISSIGADADSSNFYLRTKGEMEEAVKKVYNGNLKIVRPSLLMGNRKDYRFGERFAIFSMKILGWLFAGPLKKYRGILATDLARSMIRITDYPKSKTVFESDELHP